MTDNALYLLPALRRARDLIDRDYALPLARARVAFLRRLRGHSSKYRATSLMSGSPAANRRTWSPASSKARIVLPGESPAMCGVMRTLGSPQSG